MSNDVVLPEPTQVLRTEKNNIKLVTKLYGELTPERLAEEKRIHAHRHEQLQPYIKPAGDDPLRGFLSEDNAERRSRRRNFRNVDEDEFVDDWDEDDNY